MYRLEKQTYRLIPLFRVNTDHEFFGVAKSLMYVMFTCDIIEVNFSYHIYLHRYKSHILINYTRKVMSSSIPTQFFYFIFTQPLFEYTKRFKTK